MNLDFHFMAPQARCAVFGKCCFDSRGAVAQTAERPFKKVSGRCKSNDVGSNPGRGIRWQEKHYYICEPNTLKKCVGVA